MCGDFWLAANSCQKTCKKTAKHSLLVFRCLLMNSDLKVITNNKTSSTIQSPSSSLHLLCALTSLKMGYNLWAPFPPRLGSPWARVHSQAASSRKREAPTELVISTLSYCSGPLYWFRSGSTSGSYNCCLSLWLVTHTPRPHASFQMFCSQADVAVDIF